MAALAATVMEKEGKISKREFSHDLRTWNSANANAKYNEKIKASGGDIEELAMVEALPHTTMTPVQCLSPPRVLQVSRLDTFRSQAELLEKTIRMLTQQLEEAKAAGDTDKLDEISGNLERLVAMRNSQSGAADLPQQSNKFVVGGASELTVEEKKELQHLAELRKEVNRLQVRPAPAAGHRLCEACICWQDEIVKNKNMQKDEAKAAGQPVQEIPEELLRGHPFVHA